MLGREHKSGDLYFENFGDVAELDGDGDGIVCFALPNCESFESRAQAQQRSNRYVKDLETLPVLTATTTDEFVRLQRALFGHRPKWLTDAKVLRAEPGVPSSFYFLAARLLEAMSVPGSAPRGRAAAGQHPRSAESGRASLGVNQRLNVETRSNDQGDAV